MNEYYLEHHGVKGQKWGIRRYQNKDGSLTPAGKKRYNKEATSKHPKKWLNGLRAAKDYVNNVIIPKLQKAYANQPKLYFDKYGNLDVDKSDPELVKQYRDYQSQKYFKELDEVWGTNVSDLYKRMR